MKKTMAFLLVLAMVLPMLTVLAPLAASAVQTAVYDKPSHTAAGDASAAFTIDDSDGDGFADDYYYSKKKLESTPVTYQAWVYIPSDYSNRISGTGRDNLGVILSNSNATNDTHGAQFHFYVTKDRYVGFCYYDDVLTPYDVRFKEKTIPVATWTMVTVVWDGESGYVYCYLNGDLAEKQGFLPAIDPQIADQPLAVGVSYGSVYAAAKDQKNCLYGLQDISVYATVRTAQQVKSDYVNGVNIYDADLLCHYDLDATDKHADLADATGNGYTVQYSKKWLTEEDMEAIRAGYTFEPAFSFAAIGDTQKTMYLEGFTKGYRVNADKQITTNGGTPTKSVIYNMYQWLANSKTTKNLQLVMGLGDITDANLPVEWEIAAASTRLLGEAGIPYTMVRGNHDSYTNTHSNSYGSYTGMSHNGIDTYYGKNGTIDEYYYSQYTNSATGGMYNSSVRNVYRLVEVGTTKWLIITLDVFADDSVLAWAGDLCDTYADRNVIITTHIYLDYEGKPISYGSLSDSPNNGDDKWNELASKHANVKMVLSGHIGSDTIAVSQVKGDAGNTVTQIMIDPQGSDGLAGGLGIVTMFYFSEDGSEFYTEFYSVEKNAYLFNYNQFYVDLEAEGVEQEATQTEIHRGTKPAGSGTQADPYRISTVENLVWLAYNVNKNETQVYFKNPYFVQTCDIDLQGQTLKSIGGYFKNVSGSGLQAKAFGGHYDGCGFTIKNGTFSAAQPDVYFNKRKQNGLFGCIYGATIQNVVLEDVIIAGRGPTGGIVGKAMAPWDGSAEVGFNKIIGCHVGAGVQLRTWHPDMVTKADYDDETRAGVVGGICGIAYATEIRGCTAENTIAVTGYFGVVGGIAGTAGYNTVIDHCAFKGAIKLVDMKTYRSNSIGGIVGMISPLNSSKPDQDKTTPMAGILHVTNCYNGGTYEYTGTYDLGDTTYNVNNKNVHWGGIVGHAGGMLEVTPTAEVPYPFLIENCYNLHNEQRNEYEQSTDRYFVGGLVGRSVANNKYTSVLSLKNCYSVKVDGAGGPTSYGAYTNEYWYETQQSGLSSEGKTVIQVLDNSVGTRTAEEMHLDLCAIDVEIARIQGDYSDQANTWSVGSGAPKKAAIPGDLYLDIDTGDVWQYTGKWELIANIKGAQGDQGEQGEQGVQGEQGAQGAQGEAPVVEIREGYWYINGVSTGVRAEGLDGAAGTIGGLLTIGTNGNWFIDGVDTGVLAQGPKGEQGNTGATGATGAQGDKGDTGASGNKWYNGTGVPSFITGVNEGDMYLNTANGDVYRYSGTAWYKNGNLMGPQGTQGAKGEKGDAAEVASPNVQDEASGADGGAVGVVAMVIAIVSLVGNGVLIVWIVRGKKKESKPECKQNVNTWFE